MPAEVAASSWDSVCIPAGRVRNVFQLPSHREPPQTIVCERHGNNCNVVVKLVQGYHWFFSTFYFLSAETVRRERHVSWGSEQLQASAWL